MNGLTREQQKEITAKIHADARTVNAWARMRKFNERTVQAVLGGEYGRKLNLSPKAQEIVDALAVDGYFER